ncbi:MAG: hypothetical protein FJ280_00910 [Planctomycetes bacterium]|nr:hypothetical protein [Planctomycetota bacterium]
MDGLIGAILALFAVVLVIYVIGILIAAAVIIAPPILSGYWLRSQTKRFSLSRRKIWQTILLGLGLFSLPLATLLVDASVWPMALWTAFLLGLAGPATYLAVEGYRQVIWPFRRTALAEEATSQRLRHTLWFRRLRLRWLEWSVRREERRHGSFRRQRDELLSLAHRVALATEPAFYGAELARWRQAFAALPCESLQEQAATLSAESVLAKLRRAAQRSRRRAQDEPAETRQLLQAATAHVEVITRVLGGRNDSHEANVEAIETLQAEVKTLEAGFTAARDNKNKATQMIRQLRKERVVIQ